MTVLYVKRESENQKTQLVALTQQTSDDQQVLTGSDRPLINVEVNHHRLHEGRAFYAYYVQNGGAPLADGASINIVLAAGPGTTPHMTIAAFCGGDSEFSLFEGAISTGGTSFTPARRNRTIATPSNVAMVINPTVSGTGTELFEEFLPGGIKKKAGGGDGDSLEYVLAPLTNYLVRLTNMSGSAQIAELILEWYE